jgi:5-epimerase
MQARELAVRDAFEFTPRVFPDARGVFVAPYQEEHFVAAVGHPLRLAQGNHSRSPGGAVLDVVVDLRVGSPTFGAADAVRLDPASFRAIYLPEGVGHAFVALEDDTVISYLCSTGYNPAAEHGIHPLDPALALPWPDGIEPLLSDKDAAAPTLAEARAAGLLPTYADCAAWYERLRATATALGPAGATGAT